MMINLLPPEEKQNLSENKRLKIVLILGLIVFVFFISLALIFILINMSISGKMTAQKILLDQKEQEFETADTQDLKNKITQVNQNLLKLDSFYRQKPSFVDFLEKISNLLPGEIYLDSISINPVKKENNIFQVHLSGYAPSVEEVIELSENLKKDVKISQIYFPGETWLKKQNFSFSVTFQAQIDKQQ
ncbi:MAG: PilN domain-containing protein [Parcubacteria group bacterium]